MVLNKEILKYITTHGRIFSSSLADYSLADESMFGYLSCMFQKVVM